MFVFFLNNEFAIELSSSNMTLDNMNNVVQRYAACERRKALTLVNVFRCRCLAELVVGLLVDSARGIALAECRSVRLQVETFPKR